MAGMLSGPILKVFLMLINYHRYLMTIGRSGADSGEAKVSRDSSTLMGQSLLSSSLALA